MGRYLTGLLLFFACFSAAADAYQVFEENGKVGLKNEEGRILLPASFQALGWTDGSFSVAGQVTGYKLGDNWGLINLRKEYITQAVFESLTYAGGDRVVALQKAGLSSSRYGCIDLRGKVVVPFQYDGLKIQGMRAIVFNKKGARFEHGLIDLENNLIIPIQFKNIHAIGSLRYAVENFENKTGLYSEQGARLTDFVIDSISHFRKGYAVMYQELKQGLLNFEGQVVVPPTYREIKISEDGGVSARLFDEWQIMDGSNHAYEKIQADQLSVLAPGLLCISVAGKKGITDDHLNLKIPPLYDELREFREGKMMVRQNRKWGIIRMDQSEVIPVRFDSIKWDGTFIQAYENSFQRQGWNVYDTFGIKKTFRHFDGMGAFNGKFFRVKSRGFTGAVNRYGEEFIHSVFDSLVEWNDNLMVVKFKGQFGIIDFSENWLVVPQHYPLMLVNEEKYLVRQPPMTYLHSMAGELIYFTDNPIYLKGDHLLEFLPDGSEKTVSLNGQLLERVPFSPDDEMIGEPAEGMRGIKRAGRYGFVDDKGRLRVANRYENIGRFSEGLAAIMIRGKWGFVDIHDNIIIQPNYDAIQEFKNGTSVVRRNGKGGVIDTAGLARLPFRYDDIKRSRYGHFILQLNHHLGMASETGKVIVEPEFEHVEDTASGMIIVGKAGKYGLLTAEGLSTIPMVYDALLPLNEKNQFLVLRRAEWKPVLVN